MTESQLIVEKTKNASKKERKKPTRTLPTDRINFIRQLEILRAWAAASSPHGKVVANNEVAELVKMNASTISLANPFFSSIGLLQKSEGGYIPSSEAVAYLRAMEWSPDTASHKLAPCIKDSWFGQALFPKLAFRQMSVDHAIQTIADAADAGVEYRNQIRVLLDYSIAAGLAQREGDQVKQARPEFGQAPDSLSLGDKIKEAETSPQPKKEAVTTAFAQSPEGAISFHISVRVNMEELSTWEPTRISSFFAGIAQMLAAKAKVEGAE